MTDAEAVETTETDNVEADEVEETTEVVDEDPTAGLKKALAAERKLRRDAERIARDLEAARADADKEPAEQAIEAARREAREQAQEAFNTRLVQAELKAALAGKVSNTALALKVIDTSVIDVSADGEVDPQSVTDAIADALSQYPELAPSGGRKFPGTADQGAKGKDTKPAQLTKSDLSNMTPEQIVAAYEAGQVSDLVKGS